MTTYLISCLSKYSFKLDSGMVTSIVKSFTTELGQAFAVCLKFH